MKTLKKSSVVVLVAVLTLLFVASNASAMFDVFLKISTIPGECTDDAHAEWIEVSSFGQNLEQASSSSVSSGGSGTAERVHFYDLIVVKNLDKASPLLALACANGEHIPEVKLEFCRSGGDKNKYFEIILEDVMVTSVFFRGSGQSEDALPEEEVSFNFGKITYVYSETDHKTGKTGGNIQTFWDLQANKGG